MCQPEPPPITTLKLHYFVYIFFLALIYFLFYNQVAAFGAEALSARIEDEAEEMGWTLAKHFKLHLHPQTMKEKHNLTIDRTYAIIIRKVELSIKACLYL